MVRNQLNIFSDILINHGQFSDPLPFPEYLSGVVDRYYTIRINLTDEINKNTI